MRFKKIPVYCCLLLVLTTSSALAECKQYIELWSAREVAEEMGKTEAWVVGNHKINVWKKTTTQGRFPAVGKMLPGSRALLLEISGNNFKIKSPLDGSVGWVGELQVKRMLMQDDKTFKSCK